jgi:anaerobic dimethyl sulfoxide reductase subunit B (iron-sulfur subunit)
MTQYAFFFDESRCIDCRACAIACRDWNGIEPGPVKWLRRFTWEEGVFPEVKMHYLFASCFHCEQPLCLEACPNNALYKEERFGAVLVDEARCQGAHQCWIACPYGVPQFADDAPGTKMSKCTMCIDRLVQGQMPVCVNSCPTRALDFGPLEEMKARYGDLQALAGMPDPSETRPSIVFKPASPKRQLVPYDAGKALRLFGQRGEQLSPLYTDPAAVTEIPDGVVGKDKLVLKAPSIVEALAATRSDEW